jgi:glyoxylase-like metal-dependent hydrolase (beta-lactamase superfamily II)
MVEHTYHTIDLGFLNHNGTIAAYAIPHRHGVVLIECGPGSTQAGLQSGLKNLGYQMTDVTDVFLTHIHQD